MSGTVSRHTANQAANWRAVKAMRQIASEVQLERGTLRAISAVGEYAVSEVEYLKRLQHLVEMSNPDAADAIAAIVNIAIAGIARRVGQFTSEVGW